MSNSMSNSMCSDYAAVTDLRAADPYPADDDADSAVATAVSMVR